MSSGSYTLTAKAWDNDGEMSEDSITVYIGSTAAVIPSGSWSITSVSSEETSGEDGAAANIFDGDSSTYWHTAWSGDPDPVHPHELTIDLGAICSLEGMRILARQDGSDNGRIQDFSLAVSSDGSQFTQVLTDTLADSSAWQERSLTPVSDIRYVRLTTLSGYDGDIWACAAELELLGSLSSQNQAPSVSITAPAAGTVLSTGADCEVTVLASDPDGSIDHVDLYLNGSFVRTENYAAYEWGFDGQNDTALENMSAGTYELTAVAYDDQGASTTSAAVAFTVGSERTALSSLDWQSATIGWGEVHKDASVEGNPLHIGNVQYDTGIGTHAESVITYSLDGAYSLFEAVIGIDDEVSGTGDCVFEVWTDGVRIYQSPLIRDSEGGTAIALDISGAQELTLKALTGDGSAAQDHADWAEAWLSSGSAPVHTVYLSDTAWESATIGWGTIGLDQSVEGNALRIGGAQYDKGIGTHADSTIIYNLAGKAREFMATVGIDDEVSSTGDCVFEVWTDGVRIYQSSLISYDQGGTVLALDVSGVQELKLIALTGDGSAAADHADWAEARITTTVPDYFTGNPPAGTALLVSSFPDHLGSTAGTPQVLAGPGEHLLAADIPASAAASLYDSRGALVAKLGEGASDVAGCIYWDTLRADGTPAPLGLYILRISHRGTTVSKALVLTR